MKKEVKSKQITPFERCLSNLEDGVTPESPEMRIIADGMTKTLEAYLYCNIERGSGDPQACITLTIVGEDPNENIEVDLTMFTSLGSIGKSFRKKMVPVHILIIQPNLDCVGTLIAHTIAEEADYIVYIKHSNDPRKVRIILYFEKTHTCLDALMERSKIETYLGWSPLDEVSDSPV